MERDSMQNQNSQINTQNTDTIFIEGLQTQAIIGIYDWERENRQPLIFDIDMQVSITQAAESDNIDDTVNYKQVSDEIIALVEESRYELLERLCEEICQHIFKHHNAVQTIYLKVSKPMAVAETKTVGLKLTRVRA